MIIIINEKNPVVLVCVTNQRDCVRLIEAGVKISETIENSKVCVFSVRPQNAMGEELGEALEYLRQQASLNDADMMIVFDNDAVFATSSYVKEVNAVQIVTGIAGNGTSGFIDRLRNQIPETIISMVSKDGIIHNLYPENYCPYENPVRTI